MPNSIKERPLDPIFAELQAMGAKPNGALWEYFRTLVPSTDKTITQKGEIKLQAPIVGRTEGIGTTVGGLANTGDILAATKVVGRTEGLGTTTANLDATGKLLSTDAIAADGTGSPLTGGKRAAVALDTNNRLAASRRNNGLNVSMSPTSPTVLSNNHLVTAIVVAASTMQLGDGTVSYNAGSVDPGSFGGPFYVYADDPTYAGGAVAYVVSASPFDQVASDGRIQFGTITTNNAASTTGGGYQGGNGKTGGRGFNT